ncbi:MAG: hypothetical protein RI883_929 [Bacteroidota bacterium]|jgi:uncharacterized protein (TIGR02757 family)
MNFQELTDFLNFKAEQYENPIFLESDPIQLPHRFSRKEDIEIVGFLISTIAWGNRKSIIKSGERLLEIMEQNPFEYIKTYNSKNLEHSNFVHRTFNIVDLDFYFRSLQNIYYRGTLEDAFQNTSSFNGVQGRIISFREKFMEVEHLDRSHKHLSNPSKNSAAKRLNMYLRWMTRDAKKGVDFGIWKSISTSELFIPLDVHTSNNARRLGLLARKQDDWKALEELMAQIQLMDPIDPVKYDFALFGLGAFEKF